MITVDFSRLKIRPGFRILDIGSGPGRHTAEAYGFKEVTAVGADRSHEDLKKARERLEFHDRLGAHGGGRWFLSVADITSLPFPDGYFDLVICSEVMEHIPDDEMAARELVRVLKPGCNLVVSVPRFLPEWICWQLAPDYGNANQGHVRIYTRGRISGLIQRCGVSRWAAHHAHSLHSPYWWLKCLVGPTRENHPLVNLYHRLLVWDIMKAPFLTRFVDRLLNPLIGKSLVLYFRKPAV